MWVIIINLVVINGIRRDRMSFQRLGCKKPWTSVCSFSWIACFGVSLLSALRQSWRDAHMPKNWGSSGRQPPRNQYPQSNTCGGVRPAKYWVGLKVYPPRVECSDYTSPAWQLVCNLMRDPDLPAPTYAWTTETNVVWSHKVWEKFVV